MANKPSKNSTKSLYFCAQVLDQFSEMGESIVLIMTTMLPVLWGHHVTEQENICNLELTRRQIADLVVKMRILNQE